MWCRSRNKTPFPSTTCSWEQGKQIARKRLLPNRYGWQLWRSSELKLPYSLDAARTTPNLTNRRKSEKRRDTLCDAAGTSLSHHVPGFAYDRHDDESNRWAEREEGENGYEASGVGNQEAGREQVQSREVEEGKRRRRWCLYHRKRTRKQIHVTKKDIWAAFRSFCLIHGCDEREKMMTERNELKVLREREKNVEKVSCAKKCQLKSDRKVSLPALHYFHCWCCSTWRSSRVIFVFCR